MTPQEQAQIRKLNQRLSTDVRLVFLENGGERSRRISAFCDELVRLVPKIRVAKESAEPGAAPALLIGQGLQYRALPEGHELEPFLEALEMHANRRFMVSDNMRAQLQKVTLPAALKLYVAPQCRFCPETVRKLLAFPFVSDRVQLAVIDGFLFPEAAQADKVQSVPTVILDESLRWTGTVSRTGIIEMMIKRDPGLMSASSLERMVKQGEAAALAKMMLDQSIIFPAYLQLLLHSQWSVRLGAMVVLEEVADKNPHLAAQVVAPMWRQFEQAPDPVKGDIIYILGELKALDMTANLEAILDGNFNNEVKEAAAEALEKIKTA